MPATVVAERVGWSRSPAWFRENVARIRPEYAPADPADRISYEAGDQAQCDLWFPEVRIPVGTGKPRVLPVLVMVSSHSRFIMARMIPSRMTGDLLAGMWDLLGSLGAVPRRLIWDNETGIGRRNSYAAGSRRSPVSSGPGSCRSSPTTQRAKASWSGPTSSWKPRSCPAGFSHRRRISTPSSRAGCSRPIPGWSGGPAPGPRSCSPRIRRRCWRSRRFRP